MVLFDGCSLVLFTPLLKPLAQPDLCPHVIYKRGKGKCAFGYDSKRQLVQLVENLLH